MSLPVSIKEVPFFRLIVPFVAGIACQYWVLCLTFSWWYYSVVFLLLLAVFFSFFLSSFWRFRWLFGVAINLFLFFFGVVITIKQPTTDKIIENECNRAILCLLDNPQLRAKSIRAEVEVQFISASSIWWSVKEKMLVYFNAGDSLASDLKYGTEIAVNITPQPISESGNPYQFDYRKYLSDRGVNYTAYIKPGSWIVVDNKGAWIKRKALLLRDKLVFMFKSYGLSGDELAVASALTLGYQDLLDDELRQVYSSSGAMHILSVSGLHVGILYVLFSFLLSFMDKRTITRAVKAVVLIMFLWFFALLTGLPPCVQRSALMFSFLVVSDFFNRKSNIYNTLAASAFVLLLINPYNLLDIGFQLSYLAVISIVFFYPYIYKLIYFKNWALDNIWSLIAVSIAAQFGTFSICLFYFNQFPNYFLLANLIAIPLSTIALYLSVLLVVVSPIPLVAVWIGRLFSYSVVLLNNGLEFVEKLPFSLTEGLYISALQMFIVVGMTLSISLYLVSKRNRYIFVTLSLAILFLFLNLESYIKKVNAKEFIVFNISKKSLVSIRLGSNLLFIDTDTSRKPFGEKYNFFVKGYISSVGLAKDYKVEIPCAKEIITSDYSPIKLKSLHGVSFISFNSKTIVIPYDKSLAKFECADRFKVDYLIINQYSSIKILDFFRPNMVIIDSSTSKYVLRDIALLCRKENIPYYITSERGAFIMKETDTRT